MTVNSRFHTMIRIKNELILLNLLAIALILAILFSLSNILHLILGLPFVLFFPGYTLVAVLFPKREGIGGIGRIALSFGMSIIVTALIGIILNYTPWGITPESVLYSLASFIFIISIIAWVRRRGLGEGERFGIEFPLRLPGWDGNTWNKTLSVVLVIIILGTLGMLGYVLAMPKVGEKFTEFYILGQERQAAEYPRELKVGDKQRVVVGIINREQKTVSYWVEVRIDGVMNNKVKPIVLEQDERWEGEISFVPEMAGKNQKVEFLLYKEGESEPCFEPLYFWLDVRD